MEDNTKFQTGTLGWFDLTVDNAEAARDFYHAVAGWNYQELSLGEYNDFVMTIPGSNVPVAGICHARGANKNIPPYWIMYITVENIQKSVAECLRLGGMLLSEIKNFGDQGYYCFIKDPAGAPVALYQPVQQ